MLALEEALASRDAAFFQVPGALPREGMVPVLAGVGYAAVDEDDDAEEEA